MSARNWTLAVKFTAVGWFATTAPMPVPMPGSSVGTLVESTHGFEPRPVMVITIRTGTVCGPTVPGPGLVQLVLPCQVAVVPLMPVKVRGSSVPSSAPCGSEAEDGPQYSLPHVPGEKFE
jgi:hypothetical protein